MCLGVVPSLLSFSFPHFFFFFTVNKFLLACDIVIIIIISECLELQRPEAGVFWETAFGSLYLERCAQKGMPRFFA